MADVLALVLVLADAFVVVVCAGDVIAGEGGSGDSRGHRERLRLGALVLLPELLLLLLLHLTRTSRLVRDVGGVS